MLIHHRFSDHIISKDAEIVIIGTFNPETSENKADFFYGRSQNYLWQLLPIAFGELSLKNKSREEKIRFMKEHNLDFTDLITSVNVEKPDDYRDDYIDSHIVEWRDVIGQLKQLQKLRKVCFTRKTFSGIPNIRKQMLEIEDYCRKNSIHFQLLITPTRGYNVMKQKEWDVILLK